MSPENPTPTPTPKSIAEALEPIFDDILGEDPSATFSVEVQVITNSHFYPDDLDRIGRKLEKISREQDLPLGVIIRGHKHS